jgi:hypothetical protein
MDEEIDDLYTYISNLSLILESVEKGRFPITSSFGITRYHIPQTDRALTKLKFERRERLKVRIWEVEKINAKLADSASVRSETPPHVPRNQEHSHESILDELSSHETVQYIRRLEDERDFFKFNLRDATRRASKLKIAFESQGRALQDPALRPDSAFKSRGTSRAMSGASSTSWPAIAFMSSRKDAGSRASSAGFQR